MYLFYNKVRIDRARVVGCSANAHFNAFECIDKKKSNAFECIDKKKKYKRIIKKKKTRRVTSFEESPFQISNEFSAMPKCGNCGSEEALKKCARCLETVYCSKDCQTKHWQLHKETCRKISAQEAAMLRLRETATRLVAKVQAAPTTGDVLLDTMAAMGHSAHQVPFGQMDYDKMPDQELRTAKSRASKMLHSFEKSTNLSEHTIAVKKVVDAYPVCAAENCLNISFKRCKRCMSATKKYCSRECQIADWPVHSKTCKKPAMD